MRSPNQKLENFSVYLTILLSKGNTPLKIVTQIDLLDTLLKMEKEKISSVTAKIICFSFLAGNTGRMITKSIELF